MSTQVVTRPLPWRRFCPLLLAMFAIAVGYGFLLPILPRMLERIVPTADPAALSRHTGLLTGTYALALFLFAPLWGRFADRCGRRPAILLGLVGFATTLALFAVVRSLPLLYLERALGGLFASSIAPAVYAFVGDNAPSKEWRAHRFALLNIAGATGFLVGPMLGGLTMHVVRNFLPRVGATEAYWPPFLVTSGLAFAVALTVWAFVPSANRREGDAPGTDGTQEGHTPLLRFLAISFVTAAAVGAFEVGLSLRGTQILGMSTASIGLMFTECSLVMLTVQSLVFSPLVKPEATRWFLTPALAVLAASLAAVPFAVNSLAMAVAVALVAGSAGIISPIATYWISLGAGERQGVALGWQTAAASLGQSVGSASGGVLFSAAFIPNASFTLTAMIVLVGLLASVRVPRLLAPTRFRSQGKAGIAPFAKSALSDAPRVKGRKQVE
ncbi:major Facilitator Superfamily protein [Paraburkholderia fungorum]|uniref:Major Facilitator Superfamily protein n=1 Tax=Paraburkholderia fungorum TaxID=134537 RepID=A0AAU8SRW1_9BURK|nr:MFS transporter [Paraburkholderia fungorum]AJZ56621.1 major Facilitator Superfamily protein [Paraburkholderia fungorum]